MVATREAWQANYGISWIMGLVLLAMSAGCFFTAPHTDLPVYLNVCGAVFLVFSVVLGYFAWVIKRKYLSEA
jgi:hypothetical protein